MLSEGDLDARIRSAFSASVSSQTIAGLIAAAEQAAQTAGRAAEAARVRALDPALAIYNADYGVKPHDPTTFLVGPLFLAAVALNGVPVAGSAGSPMVTLRSE